MTAVSAVVATAGALLGSLAVLSFIYADLIVPPLVNAYRRYCGGRLAAALFLGFAGAAVVAGALTDLLFGALGLIPPLTAPTTPSPTATRPFSTSGSRSHSASRSSPRAAPRASNCRSGRSPTGSVGGGRAPPRSGESTGGAAGPRSEPATPSST